MLIELLQNNGSATINQIARSLLDRDISQVEYYEHITKSMVGRVLTKNRGITEKQGDSYSLNGFGELAQDEVDQLVEDCISRIDEYVTRRGEGIWSHRRKSSGYISGTDRYEILKRAKFRCELCGVSAEEKALEVDHIVPRNKRGSDDLSNLQALCYSCNSMKRDKDDTDFRGIAESYNDRKEGCLFCVTKPDQIIDENELCLAWKDSYPVTERHTLIIPKRHVESYFDLYQPEINAIHQMLNKMKKKIEEQDNTVTGFNVGVNDGKDAGQSIFHVHVHLIPRRKGDTENPKGGVRGAIPYKRTY
jgi:diadenosine tetraphosphate (Ap4A) HIT family hydrolase/5-methylcytosine-specific restriction endonuclease McrA